MIRLPAKPTRSGGLFFAECALPAILVAGICVLFRFALPGIVHFDDIGNLSGLASVDGLAQGWRWMQEGRAGPLGRPLALATFLLQYYQWPDPEPFLRWNIALHAINALLVFWLAWLVGKPLGFTRERRLAVGFFTALAWGVSPLLNTSVLFIVQRMALLSATFVLAGLVAYLKLRGPAEPSWQRQFGALLALGIAGGLAMLAKENGAIVVVYALALEGLILVQAGRHRPSFAAWLLLAACVLLIAGLLRYVDWSTCSELQRGYTMLERLGSQGWILASYLKTLVLPVSAELNPFRYEFFLQDGLRSTAFGLVLWVAFFAAPWAFWWMGRRLVALALFWFFYGHIIESGWLSLEPYFAHRNYLPTIGLLFAVVYVVATVRNSKLFWRAAGVGYLGLLVGVTGMNTNLWGNRALASEIWAMQEPTSIRAALNLGYYLERTEGLAAAQQFLDRIMLHERDSAGLRLQRIISACTINPEQNQRALIEEAVRAIETLRYEGWATDLAEEVMTAALSDSPCEGVGVDQVVEIASAFLRDPAYQCNKPASHNLLSLLGLAALVQGDTTVGRQFYWQALNERVSYALTNHYFELISEAGDHQALVALAGLVQFAPTPRGATKLEWADLKLQIAEAAEAP